MQSSSTKPTTVVLEAPLKRKCAIGARLTQCKTLAAHVAEDHSLIRSRSRSRGGFAEYPETKRLKPSNRQNTSKSYIRTKSPLWLALEEHSKRRCLEKVRAALRTETDLENAYLSWSYLMKAAEVGWPDAMGLLLNAKAEIDRVNHKGRSALSFAAAPSMNQPHCVRGVQLLLQRKANSLQRDVRGLTPLDHARREGRSEIVLLLQRST